MVNGKMCVGVVGDEMMCRIDHAPMKREALEEPVVGNGLHRKNNEDMAFSTEGLKSKKKMEY